MSYVPPNAPPPRQPSFVGDLQPARPTLVRVLVASLYLPALMPLGLVAWTVAAVPNQPLSVAVPSLIIGLALAMIAFFLGKGIARGSHTMWVVILILSAIGAVQALPALLMLPFFLEGGVGLVGIVAVSLAIPVVVLALVLAPTVRQHCTK